MTDQERKTLLTQIEKALNKHQDKVAFAYLFGSSVIKDYQYKSDVDVAVYLKKDYLALGGQSLDAFIFDVKLSIQADLCRALKRNDVDLVILNTLKNYFLEDDVIRKGLVVYGKDHPYRQLYEVKRQHEIIDFKQQRKAILGAK